MIEAILLSIVLLASAASLPPFDQFSVKKTFNGKAARIDLKSDRKAKEYQTALREGAQKGPNFAGHYTIVPIGCGSGCTKIAVVDAGNGKVFFPKGLSQIITAGWWHEPEGPVFRLSSRLLVVYGETNSENAPYGISYFEWTGNEFKLLRFEPHDRGKPPE